MSPLNHSRLLCLLADPSQQETGATMLQVYNDFVKQLIFYCNQEVAPALLSQNMHGIRIEFESLKAMEELLGSGKKWIESPHPRWSNPPTETWTQTALQEDTISRFLYRKSLKAKNLSFPSSYNKSDS